MEGESDMENKNTDVGFNYTYSAVEQDEIRKIREKYQPKKEHRNKQSRNRCFTNGN